MIFLDKIALLSSDSRARRGGIKVRFRGRIPNFDAMQYSQQNAAVQHYFVITI